jgi:uncharacterized membrane protein YagU involved in acid resistance
MVHLIRGALAGALATVPMSVVMLLLWRGLPRRQRYPLPPWLITSNLLGQVGLKRKTSRDATTFLTWLLHFSYGGAVGALFVPLQRALRVPAVLLGPLYGIIVWVGSYKGLLPMFNLLSDASRHPDKRNAVMIAAHLVWGAFTGLLVASLPEEVLQ